MEVVSVTRTRKNPVLHRWKDLQNRMDNTNIEDYFGIIPEKNDRISFAVEKDPDNKYCIFTVKYVTQNTPDICLDFADLPESVSCLIAEYFCRTIELKFKITFPETYPFEAPIWSLVEEKNDMTHLPKQFVLGEYYQDIVNRHNSSYCNGGYNWTPAITIRTDILLFIEKIHHFEMISQYCE